MVHLPLIKVLLIGLDFIPIENSEPRAIAVAILAEHIKLGGYGGSSYSQDVVRFGPIVFEEWENVTVRQVKTL